LSETEDAFLFRWVDIPIDPYPELVVVENDWEGVIDKVVIWQGNNRPQREIECRTASDGRSIHQKERTDADMAECVKGYVERCLSTAANAGPTDPG
jgi:hypothetical protein